MVNEVVKAKTDGNSSISELTEWGKFAVQSGILPAGINAMQAMAIIQTGKELGVPPMAALRTMAFVKGRLVLSTQLMLALARDKGIQVGKIESGDGKCSATLLRGDESVTCEWTMEMAKKANLSAKDNWTCYPAQMLRWRAICDALRLIAPDFVMGLTSAEEAEDMEAPFALDPTAAVTPDAPKTVPPPSPFEKIGLKERTAISQAMTRNGWVVKGAMTPAAIDKLGQLGYENSAQIPMREYENVLRVFSEPAPEEKAAV